MTPDEIGTWLQICLFGLWTISGLTIPYALGSKKRPKR